MNTMEGVSMRQPMVGTYDFTWLAELGQKSKDQESERSDRVLLVDIGGSKGHCIRAIVEATPGLEFDRCILEDLEEVVEEVQKTAQGGLERVKFMTVDFHSSQPVKGASSSVLTGGSQLFVLPYADQNRSRTLLHPSLPPRLQRPSLH